MTDENVTPEENDEPFLSGPLYDKLKFLAQVLLPAVGTLYVALSALWGFPKPEEVSGTVLAVDTFLGIILHLSTQQFKNVMARAKPDGYLTAENVTSSGLTEFRINVTPNGVEKALNGEPVKLVTTHQPDPPVTR